MIGAAARRRVSEGTRTDALVAWTAWSVSRALGLAAMSGALVYGMRGVIGTGTDVNLYFFWSFLFHHGYMPYKNFPVVYPPGIIPALVLPAPNVSIYTGEFTVLALMADAAVFARLRRAARLWGSWSWLVGALLIGPVFWSRLDVFVAGAVVASVLDVEAGRSTRAAFWLGLAASLKVWPLLLVIPIVVRGADRRARVRAVLAALVAPVVCTVPVMVFGGTGGLWGAVGAQAGRGLEVESVFAWPLEAARAVGLWSSGPKDGVAWQFLGATASALGDLATILLLLAVAGWTLLALRRRTGGMLPFSLLTLGLAAVLVATGKVLSPQYALWVLAGAVVVLDGAQARRLRRRLLPWLGVFFVTTQALFPFAFESLLSGGWPGTVVATLHTAATLGLLGAVVSTLVRETHLSGATGPSEVTRDRTAEVYRDRQAEPTPNLVPLVASA